MSLKRRKTLGVCGDSFMSQTKNNKKGKDKHFIDFLSKKLNCDVVTFALGGCSNNVIRLQINEIMKYRLDYLIIGLTTADRLELPVSPKDLSYYKKLENSNYKKENGVYNIFYGSDNLSSNNTPFKLIKPTLRSETLANIILDNCSSDYGQLSEEETSAVVEYFKYMYDDKLKRQIDSWVISDALADLNEKKINYTVINSCLDPEIIEKRSKDTVKSDDKLNPWLYTSYDTNHTFHLTEENSIILSDLWYDKIKSYFI